MGSFSCKIYKINMFFVIVAGLGVLYLGYLANFPRKAIEFDDDLLPIVSKFTKGEVWNGLPIFSPGDIVPLRIKGTRYTGLPASVSTRIVNETSRSLPDKTIVNKTGPFDVVSLAYFVPRDSLRGIHHFEITWDFEFSFLHRIVVTKRSEPFYVRQRSECDGS